MATLMERFRWQLLGRGLKGLAFALKRGRKKDPMLERALMEFEGVYRFENRSKILQWHIVLKKGAVKIEREWAGPVNFTFTLNQPRDLSIRVRPEHVLEVLIANKIGQNGDLYYLYQFGFILSLLRRALTPKRFARSVPNASR